MNDLHLQFKPIDLGRHAHLCLEFIKDTHLCSFGSMEGFNEEAQEREMQQFTERIAAKLFQDPESCLHVWKGNTLVGQLNFGTFIDPSIGYISHFSVTPEWRGTGVAAKMDAYADNHFRRRGFRSARLSVTAANTRAVRFYLKHGWQDLGPRADNPLIRNMEKVYE